MTLIELLLLMAWVGLAVGGLLAGVLAGGWWGPLGLLLGVAAGPAIWAVLAGLTDLFYQISPLRPRCARGVCGQYDYELTLEDQGNRWTCRCGDAYFAPHTDPPELRRYVDGKTVPYMVKTGLRWRPDERPAGPVYR